MILKINIRISILIILVIILLLIRLRHLLLLLRKRWFYTVYRLLNKTKISILTLIDKALPTVLSRWLKFRCSTKIIFVHLYLPLIIPECCFCLVILHSNIKLFLLIVHVILLFLLLILCSWTTSILILSLHRCLKLILVVLSRRLIIRSHLELRSWLTVIILHLASFYLSFFSHCQNIFQVWKIYFEIRAKVS